MNSIDAHEEAIEAGFSRRDASQLAAWTDIGNLAREIRRRQSDFLSEIGMTWDEAKALDDDGRAALNEQWAAYCEGRDHSPAAAP